MYTYEQGKATEADLMRKVNSLSDEHKARPSERTKLELELAISTQKLFSAGFTRRYAAEMIAESAANREMKRTQRKHA